MWGVLWFLLLFSCVLFLVRAAVSVDWKECSFVVRYGRTGRLFLAPTTMWKLVR